MKLQKIKHFWRKFSDYMRHDFKEIVAPSCLPDPPDYVPPERISWAEQKQRFKIAVKLYIASYKYEMTDEVIMNIAQGRHPLHEVKQPEKPKENGTDNEPSMLEDLEIASKGGIETLRPVLHRIYMMRATVFKDSLRNFVEGYKEGIAETLVQQQTELRQRAEELRTQVKAASSAEKDNKAGKAYSHPEAENKHAGEERRESKAPNLNEEIRKEGNTPHSSGEENKESRATDVTENDKDKEKPTHSREERKEDK